MVSIQVEEKSEGVTSAILDGLREHIEKTVGGLENQPLSVTLRDGETLLGGLIGATYFGWLFIQYFWIDEQYRGKGFGKQLLDAAENEARRRGARNVFLDTLSLQAPEFYKKYGYREYGRLDAFPVGHYRSWMTKAL